jgi:hypothetical protein
MAPEYQVVVHPVAAGRISVPFPAVLERSFRPNQRATILRTPFNTHSDGLVSCSGREIFRDYTVEHMPHSWEAGLDRGCALRTYGNGLRTVSQR